MNSGLRQKYQKYLAQWKQHCENVGFSSNPNDYEECDAVTKIINLGKDVLPLIQETLATDPEPDFCIFGWTLLINKITGQPLRIPPKMQGKVKDILQHTKNHLDLYLSVMKYWEFKKKYK